MHGRRSSGWLARTTEVVLEGMAGKDANRMGSTSTEAVRKGAKAKMRR